MRPTLPARSGIALTALAASACSAPSRTAWSIDFRSETQGVATSFVEARIRREACDTGPIVRDFGRLGRTGSVTMPETMLEPGRYCFEADAIDRSCVRVAAARVPVSLPSAGPIALVLAPVEPSRLCSQRVCAEGVCEPIDAGVDAGFDASLPDANFALPDAYLPPVPGVATGCEEALVLAASAGGAHTCAIVLPEALYCWGDDSSGQLGVGGRGEARLPVLVGRGYTQVQAGGGHTCALDRSQALWCWGRNDHGQVGDDTTTQRATPVRVMDEILGFTVGALHTCAIRFFLDMASSTYVYQTLCWGSNEHGQLGIAGPDRHTPTLTPIDGLTSIHAGATHTCGRSNLMGAAIPLCWGEAGPWLGHAGGGPTPERVGGDLTGFWQFDVGRHVTCATVPTPDFSASFAWCWGEGVDGRLLDGTSRDSVRPVMGSLAGAVSVGGSITCQTDLSLGVRCAGPASTGIRGPTPSGNLAPDLVLPWRFSLTAGDRHACGFGGDGLLACWGANEHGQLGTGAATDVEPTPHRVCF